MHSENDEVRFKHNFSCSCRSDAAFNAVWCWAGRYCGYCQLTFIKEFQEASFFHIYFKTDFASSFIFDKLVIFLLGVDIDAATKHGIKVARIPGDVTGNAASCAEMAIYLMLGLLRKQVCHLEF